MAERSNGSKPRRLGALLGGALREHLGLALFVAIYAATAAIVAEAVGRSVNFTMAAKAGLLATMVLAVFVPAMVALQLVRLRRTAPRTSPTRHLLNQSIAYVTEARRLAGGLVFLAIFTVFMLSFSTLKDAIPSLNPFSWDIAFRDLDNWMFFGVPPWKLSFAVFGSGFATFVLNLFYNAWFFVLYILVLWIAFVANDRRFRLQFLYAYFLVWAVGGNLLAAVFSSAGPVYFARLGLGPDFEPQMTALNAIAETWPIWALDTQEALWSAYSNGAGAISGISAMPSMHVASAFLFMLAGYRIDRRLGHALAFFAGVIVIGSVHLGWHYFADALLGMAVTLAAWAAAAFLARWDCRRIEAAEIATCGASPTGETVLQLR
ncbi:phosphatase PAP2 family protein [Jiella marina]|uniref:phosphatase PAP2 family protein n=1 Tax=Jiella sp. LLJ827 TaxID=2917712 RepID=UPI002101348B|nr:phosphatase PAP2 family protein [Jiella sp. LLJ827]MCQ0987788.1 phosphatase PAP2 family protein [Jiella sp. LLJ827]